MSINAGGFSYSKPLDGLRAIAVLGVLVSHYGLGSHLAFVVDAFPWGHVGVRLFFVLSGFLITSILLNCRHLIYDEGLKIKLVLKQFYIRRVLRIFPLFYIVILVTYFLNVENMRDVAIFHVFYLSNTSSALTGTLEAFAPLRDPTSAHFWSLAVEEQFYLIWPAVVLFFSIKNIIRISIVAIFISPILRAAWFALGYDQLFNYLPMCMDALSAGALLALYREGELSHLKFLSKYKKLIFYVGLGLYVFSLALHFSSVWYKPKVIIMSFSEGIVYSFFIYALIKNKLPNISRILSIRPLVEIGKISYAIYILHAFIFVAFNSLFLVDEERSLLMFFVYTGITIITAAISWYALEHPINKLKHKFPYDYSKAS